MGRLTHEMPPDSTAKFLLKLSTPAYSTPVKVEISGPKGGLSLELLRGGEILTASVGITLTLEAIARNHSDTARTAELSFQSVEKNVSSSTITLPPKSPVSFREEWTPLTPGIHEISLELREQGRLIDRRSWHIAAGASTTTPAPQPSPIIIPKGFRNQPVGPSSLIADESTKRQLVSYVQPVPVELVPVMVSESCPPEVVV